MNNLKKNKRLKGCWIKENKEFLLKLMIKFKVGYHLPSSKMINTYFVEKRY